MVEYRLNLRDGRVVHKQLSFIAMALLPLCFSAHAVQKPNEDFEECKRMEHSAKTVMESRQSDVPMSTMWGIAEESDSEYVKEMYKMLIRSAYDKPRFSLEENQKKAVTDFQNDFFSACMRNAEKRSRKKT
jgi:predicted GTPase